MSPSNLSRSMRRTTLLALTLARRTQSLVLTPPIRAATFLGQLQRAPGCTTPLTCRSHLGHRLFATVDRPAETGSDACSSDALNGPSAVRSIRPTPTDLPYFQMVSFYRFEPVPDPSAARDALFDELAKIDGLRGTAYVAKEGINAQFAVPTGAEVDSNNSAEDCTVDPNMEHFLDAFRRTLPFDPFEINVPNYGDKVDSSAPTFDRLIVRTRNAILRDGLENDGGCSNNGRSSAGRNFDWSDAGVELSPHEWDADLRRSSSSGTTTGDDGGAGDGLLLDCRNSYESEVGTFAGAIPLDTTTFSETWSVLREKTQDVDKDTPLRIFCTGGIRCVKVGAYLKQELGFEDVRRLEHGIVGYQKWVGILDDSEGEEEGGGQEEGQASGMPSLWEGENFLFDKRRLEKESHT